MVRYFGLAILAIGLTGCDQFHFGFMSRVEKINAAIPVMEELTTAKNSFFSSLDQPKLKVVQDQYSLLLEIRAVTCGGTVQIGWMDTPADIKKKIPETTCFREQDAKLLDWIGMRRFFAAVAKPPLAAFTPLGPRVVIATPTEQTVGVVAARDANILLLKGSRRQYTTVQLPGGKAIATFEAPEEAYRTGSMSPNGRVLAVPVNNNSLRLMDTETGATLWSTTKYSSVVAWLPEVDATVLSATGTAVPLLIDHVKGSVEAYPVATQRLTWSLPVAGTKGRYVAGGDRSAAIVDHVRGSDGAVTVSIAKQWTLTGQGATSSAPVLMSNGKKLVFVSMRDLAWLDLETGTQGIWNISQLSGVLNSGPAKVSESAIYLDVSIPGTPTVASLFDIEQGTLTPVQDGDTNEGLLLSIAPRTGYFRRGAQAVVVGGMPATTGTSRSMETLLNEIQLAQQLAKLKSAESFSSPEQQVDLVGRAATAQMGAGGAAAAARSLWVAGVPAPAPMLSKVPVNARVSYIGVYEAAITTPVPRGQGGNRIGSIRINVTPGNTPVVLVLSSYEPVRWIINSSGRVISAILLSSYSDSSVSGADNTPVIKIGSRYAYKIDSAEYEQLKRDVAKYVSNPVQSFQGTYKAQDFSVN